MKYFFQTLNYSITFGLKPIILHSNIDVFSLSLISVTGGCSQLEYKKNKSQFEIKINNFFFAIIGISNLNAKLFAYYFVFCVQINYFVLLLYFTLVQQFQ